ncbi:hypothetical protein MmiHf6_05530 [Methanimicrococcus hongohii]|uniref:Uncharacterized protein n=1 Tax=Methanimicrococcus hongohii TaxID=3028295 RepID=A0AA96V009_9EURY|nr:hypothetical protein [Methanimicrococcus sp. Hf6]WNY23248.1 hypothetical protein MmiHf6_05530 [Methanimicrococcus sp. Hf6]
MTGIHVTQSDSFGIHLSGIHLEGIHLDGIHLNEILSLVRFDTEV